MRINELNRNEPSENYSSFYQAFSSAIDKILDSRPIQDSTYKNYIPIEKSEKSLRRFLNQAEKGIALYRGAQGSGKSSTLFAVHKEYMSKKTTRSILIDLRRHGGKIPSSLPNITSLSEKTNACIPRIRDLMASRFQSTVRSIIEEDKLDSDLILSRVFKYCLQFNFHVIPNKFRQIEVGDEEAIFDETILDSIKDELTKDYGFHNSFYYVKYVYCLAKFRNVRKILVILDNGDQLPYEMLEAAVFCANHFSGCVNAAGAKSRRNKKIIVGKAKVKFIIACRHHNYEKLVFRSNVNALGSHSHIAISHTGLPSLHRIVSKRMLNLNKFGEYRFKKGVKLVRIDTKKCLRAYFHQLDNSGCYKQLLQVHNNNIADTFDCIKLITQNKLFPNYDDFVENFQFGSKPKKEYVLPVNADIAIRCLAWGNPEDKRKSIHPTIPNDLPSLYSWNGVNLFSFCIYFRICLLLRKLGATSKSVKMVGINEVYNLLSRAVPIDESIYINSIIEMKKSKLLVFYAENEIKRINPYDSMKLAPRAEYLMDHIRRYEPLALAILEDLNIYDHELLDKLSMTAKPLRFQSDDNKAILLNSLIELECAQITVIEETGNKDNFLALFSSGGPLSNKIYFALRSRLTDISEPIAKKITENRKILRKFYTGSNGLDALIEMEIKKASIPKSLEEGMKLIVDKLPSDSEAIKRQELLDLISEIQMELSKGKQNNKGKVKRLIDRINELVRVGKNTEQIAEWAEKLAEIIPT